MEPSTELPACMAQLFIWFCDFNRARGEGFSGPGAMTWEGLEAWCRRRKIPDLIDFETDCLLDLDVIYRNVWHEKHKKPE